MWEEGISYSLEQSNELKAKNSGAEVRIQFGVGERGDKEGRDLPICSMNGAELTQKILGGILRFRPLRKRH